MLKIFRNDEKEENRIELPPIATGHHHTPLPLRMNNPMLSRKDHEASSDFTINKNSDDAGNSLTDDYHVNYLPESNETSDAAPLLSRENSNGQYRGDTSPTFSDEHCHGFRKRDQLNKAAKRRLIFAAVVCLIFVVGEVIGKS